MTSEKRTKRSDRLYEALTYQIEAVCNEYGVSHLALGSDDGLVMASSGDDHTADWLAAIAPGIGRAWLPSGKSNDDDGMLTVVDLEVEGNVVYLAGLSDDDPTTHRGFEHAKRGVQRIFKETRAF